MNVYLIGTCGDRWFDLATRVLYFVEGRPFTFAAPEESGEPDPDLDAAVESLVGLVDNAVDIFQVALEQGDGEGNQPFVNDSPTFIVGGLTDEDRLQALTVRTTEAITRYADGSFPKVHVILLHMEGDLSGAYLADKVVSPANATLTVREVPVLNIQELPGILREASEDVSAETPLDRV